MLLFNEMKITFKAFESEISSLNIDNCSEKSKKLQWLEKSSHDHQYILPELRINSKISKSTRKIYNLTDSDNLLFTSTRTGRGIKTLTPKPMLERLPIAFVQVKAGNT